VKESLNKFFEFLDKNGFHILHDPSKSILTNDNPKVNKKGPNNIYQTYNRKNHIKKIKVLGLRRIDNPDDFIKNKIDTINCQNKLIYKIAKESNTDNNSLLLDINSDMNIEEKKNFFFNSNNLENNINYKDNNISDNYNNINNEFMNRNKHIDSNKNNFFTNFINQNDAKYIEYIDKNLQKASQVKFFLFYFVLN